MDTRAPASGDTGEEIPRGQRLFDNVFLLLLLGIVGWSFAWSLSMETPKARKLIDGAVGRPGDGGRPIALKALCAPGEDLADIDLSGAHLFEASLRRARLDHADLRDTELIGVALHAATLRGADLSGADLFNADLRGATISAPA